MAKVLIYNPYWDSLGGGERYMASVIRYFLDRKWHVDIVWKSDICKPIFDRFHIDISQANFVSSFNLLPHLYTHVFWLSDGSLPTSLVPNTIVHFQFPFQDIRGTNLVNYIKSRFYRFVCNSMFTKQVIDREFSINSSVIYPPIDTALFNPSRKKKEILYIGRFSNLTQLKGQNTLITSFKKISKHLPGWKLILAGGKGVGSTTKDTSDLVDQAKGFPIDFVFNPTFSQLQSLCSSATFFWSASGYSPSVSKAIQQEHFGITVVEAMSAGCIPIITNLGGHKEIVENQTDGILWDDPSQLESETLRLVQDVSLQRTLSEAAIIKSRKFDIKQFYNNLEQLI